jgi:ribonuclease J
MDKLTNDTKIIILGGLGEVGKNMYCVMHDDEIVIIDAGIMFPEGGPLGIDCVLPDITFLKENEDKIKALFITHGHEDHIGAIPYLVGELNIPDIYAPKQAKELIALKLEDKNLRYDNLHDYDEDTIVKFKHIQVEFFRTTHSIPDSHGILVKTPDGNIVTTGDFKFDFTPIGPVANLHKMARIGEEGVDVLISDSTNALHEGISLSEKRIDTALNDIFDEHPDKRIIIATFASNIYRLKHIVESCYNHGRKLCTFGRSMENNIKISLEGGYIDHKDIFIEPDEAANIKPSELAILCTGSQGEPLAALSRIANGTHKQIKLRPDDIVVFSSSPIPGNAIAIGRTINKLYLQGVKVYTNSSYEVHTSGHANEEELKLMIRLINPKYLMPFHGDYRMLKKHASIGVDCGIPKENTFVLQNGDVLSLKDHVVTKDEPVISSDIYVDSNRMEEVNGAVLRDRKIMASDGILVIIANIDMKNRNLLIHPNITTRGFVMVNENAELLKKIETFAEKIILKKLEEPSVTYNDIKGELTLELFPYIQELTGRKPIILPVVLDIRK